MNTNVNNVNSFNSLEIEEMVALGMSDKDICKKIIQDERKIELSKVRIDEDVDEMDEGEELD